MLDKSQWGYEEGNPSNVSTAELVKEYSSEEVYDQYASDNKIPNEVSEYVASLERKLKSKNDALKVLLGQTSENLTHHRNQINKILKL